MVGKIFGMAKMVLKIHETWVVSACFSPRMFYIHFFPELGWDTGAGHLRGLDA